MRRAGLWALAMGLVAVFGTATTLRTFTFGDVTGWTGVASPPNHTVVGWKRVQAAEFGGEPPEVRAFPSPTAALYFGKIVAGKGTFKDGGNPVQGQALSPQVSLQLPGEPPGTYAGAVKITFYQIRVVEDFPTADYDWCTVEYSFDGVTFTELKKWTSKDPAVSTWTLYESDPIPTGGAASIWIRFGFNSVDGSHNDYLGWLIDDLTVKAVPVPLKIDGGNTLLAPTAVVGTPYDVGGVPARVAATGGKPPYTWQVDSRYPLPPGLGLRNRDLTGDGWDEAVIEGTPTKAGTYVSRVIVTDAAAAVAHLDFKIRVQDPGAFPGFLETFEDALGNPALPTGWTASGLWHATGNVQVGGANVLAALPTLGAVYYGQDDVTSPNYNTYGVRNSGYLTSDRYDVSGLRGLQVFVSFDSWREVEFTSTGSYDRTFVECRFDDGPWTRIWYRDSATASTSSWTAETAPDPSTPLVVPPTASTMQLRFGFDTVDGVHNNFVGWLVDNLLIEFQPIAFEIRSPADASLPRAEVGVPYSVQFQAVGGVAPYTWTAKTRLPDHLALDRHTGVLSGIPAASEVTTAPHKIVIEAEDRNGQKAQREFSLSINPRTTLLYEDFENGLAERWESAGLGLWHITGVVAGVNLGARGKVAYYGQDDGTNPNYATGQRTSGALTSKPVVLPSGTTGFRVTFDYWREVEFYAKGGYDRTTVEVRLKKADGTWTNWYILWSKDSADPSEKQWQQSVTINRKFTNVAPGATALQIRFVFDSVDTYYNHFKGWLVDNVSVALSTTGTELASVVLPQASPRDVSISVFNYPNPIRDVHTTTFAVRGVEAEAIRVEVYDLTGRLVYRGESPGNELVWHTQDLLGRYLANGVYLYRVYVKVAGSWVVSEIQKLVILR